MSTMKLLDGELVEMGEAEQAELSVFLASLPPASDPVPKPTRRQLRLWLVRNGHSLAAVGAAIDAMPEPDRSEALIEWQDASEYDIEHPTVQAIGSALGITDLAQTAREAALL